VNHLKHPSVNYGAQIFVSWPRDRYERIANIRAEIGISSHSDTENLVLCETTGDIIPKRACRKLHVICEVILNDKTSPFRPIERARYPSFLNQHMSHSAAEKESAEKKGVKE